MPVSELRLIKHCVEFKDKTYIKKIPLRTRGVYVLYKKKSNKKKPKDDTYDVVYIGMAGGEKKAGIGGRLRSHANNTIKSRQWTHFSVFEVWDNIREEEVRELEGILRHIFRKDSHANKLGIQKSFKKLTKIKRETEKENWWDNRRSRRLANKIIKGETKC
ncbi:unnamed protein product [marine sediment metagenome]|uniref:GIY-YIG domain-containing protein n=1 Tax=marine sediment metagenome TaxID=412755 RepID=X1FLA9_9ZZZZ